jgi:hypothetical protein
MDTKLSTLTDSLKENGIEGITYSSYGSDLASYTFLSLSVIKEALYNQRFENGRTVNIAIYSVKRVYPNTHRDQYFTHG